MNIMIKILFMLYEKGEKYKAMQYLLLTTFNPLFLSIVLETNLHLNIENVVIITMCLNFQSIVVVASSSLSKISKVRSYPTFKSFK